MKALAPPPPTSRSVFYYESQLGVDCRHVKSLYGGGGAEFLLAAKIVLPPQENNYLEGGEQTNFVFMFC